jgi:hypothetical protein
MYYVLSYLPCTADATFNVLSSNWVGAGTKLKREKVEIKYHCKRDKEYNGAVMWTHRIGSGKVDSEIYIF